MIYLKIGLIVDRLDYGVHGIGNYVYNLTKKLIEIDHENEYVLIHVRKQTLNDPYHDVFNTNSEIVIEAPNIVPTNFKNMISKFIYLPKILNNIEFDIIHEMSQFKPLPYIPSLKVITIYDLITWPIKGNEFFFELSVPERVYKYIDRYLLEKILKNKVHIITISNKTKEDLIKCLGINNEKISVAYPGVDEIFKPLDSVAYVSNNYGLNYPYILYVGTLGPRKNVKSIIYSFHKIKQNGLPHKLVLVSTKKGFHYESLVMFIKKLNLEKEVIFTGFIPLCDIPKIYSAADLFVFPSFYEGFGLPPLEAMACGCPVITSNVTSLPEVVGDAGILIDPFDIDSLTKAMYKVLINEDIKRNMIKKGLERAKMFNWERTAKETIQVYEQFNN